jgi:hypothetical protein
MKLHALSPPSKLWNLTLSAKGNMIVMKNAWNFFDCTHLCLPPLQPIFQLFCHLCHNARMKKKRKALVIGQQTHNWE